MGENEKKLRESELLRAALDKCRELLESVGNFEPTENIKRDARLLGIAELNRWKQNPAAEESIIAELYPEEDPKLYFRTLEYVLRHFETIYDSIKKNRTSKIETTPTSRDVKRQIENILN
jgi:hypothetical protein